MIDHWWQTETGWPIVANPAGIELLPIKPGSPTRPLPGWDVQVLDASGKRITDGTDGAIVVKLPMPPGSLPTLWNDDDRFVSSYMAAFDGYYLTGDGGRIDDDGYVFVMGRTDDVINVAGHRLSTGGMEEVLASHPDVAECAVIGVADAMKGQVPRGFVVLKAGVVPRRGRAARRAGAARPEPDRGGGVAQGRRGRGGAAEDAVGEDPAQDHARHRRRRRRAGAEHDRERRCARRPAPGAPPLLTRVAVLTRRVAFSTRRSTDWAVRPNLGRTGNAPRHPIGWVGRPPLPTCGHPDPRGLPMSVRVAAATAALSVALALAMAGSALAAAPDVLPTAAARRGACSSPRARRRDHAAARQMRVT